MQTESYFLNSLYTLFTAFELDTHTMTSIHAYFLTLLIVSALAAASTTKLPNTSLPSIDHDFIATEIVGGTRVPTGTLPWLTGIRYNRYALTMQATPLIRKVNHQKQWELELALAPSLRPGQFQ